MNITKTELSLAFRTWQERVQANPQDFDFNAIWNEAADESEISANYLWSILKEMRGEPADV